jgi:hypothetical protein
MSGSNIAVVLAPSESRLIEVFGSSEGMRSDSKARTVK